MFTFSVQFTDILEKGFLRCYPTGKGYRNEISPRQGMIRLREFNMAELEYFIDPEVEPNHDFSDWSDKLTLISEDSGTVEMTISDAVERHNSTSYSWFLHGLDNGFLTFSWN